MPTELWFLRKSLSWSSNRMGTSSSLAVITKLVPGSGVSIYNPNQAQIPRSKRPLPLRSTNINYLSSMTDQWRSSPMIYPVSNPLSAISMRMSDPLSNQHSRCLSKLATTPIGPTLPTTMLPSSAPPPTKPSRENSIWSAKACAQPIPSKTCLSHFLPLRLQMHPICLLQP